MRTRNIISLLLTATLLSSCGGFYYGDGNANAHVRAKKSMESFSHLNEPIVITMPVWNYEWLFGNRNTSPRVVREGDIFVVYDWETEKVHDWAFFGGDHGLSNWRAVEMGNPVKYYDAGRTSQRIGCLDPADGKISVYTNPLQGTFSNLNNNMKVKSDYGIIRTYSYSDGQKIFNINAFSTRDNKVNGTGMSIAATVGTTVPATSIPDEDGDYWYGYIRDGKSWAAKIDLKNNVKTEYVICSSNNDDDAFRVELVWKGVVFLADSVGDAYGKLLIKHKDNMDLPVEYVDMPKVERKEGTFVAHGMVLSDEPYFLLMTDEIGVNVLYKYDMATKTFAFEKKIDFDLTETIYTRGSRLYMINSRRIENFKCTYYDVATKEMGNVKNISYDEIVSGKK